MTAGKHLGITDTMKDNKGISGVSLNLFQDVTTSSSAG